MSDLPISTIKSMVFGDNMNLGEPEVDDDAPNPMAEFMHRAQVAAAVKSAGGTSALLDLPVPDLDEVDVDGPFWKAPRVIRYNSDALKKATRAGDAKFVKLLGLLRNFCGDNHPEEYAEMVETVTKARDDARNEAIQGAA
jgi:hypothetical protein